MGMSPELRRVMPKLGKYWLYGTVAVATIFILLRNYYFMGVHTYAFAEPESVVAVLGAEVRIVVRTENRLGVCVPFRRERISCSIIEGETIALLRHAEDSASAFLSSTGVAGRVGVRVLVQGVPVPLFVRVEMLPALAVL